MIREKGGSGQEGNRSKRGQSLFRGLRHTRLPRLSHQEEPTPFNPAPSSRVSRKVENMTELGKLQYSDRRTQLIFRFLPFTSWARTLTQVLVKAWQVSIREKWL